MERVRVAEGSVCCCEECVYVCVTVWRVCLAVESVWDCGKCVWLLCVWVVGCGVCGCACGCVWCEKLHSISMVSMI